MSKVSCLCLTKGRREWLPQAIACFQAQTYADLELIVVADQWFDINGLVPSHPSIKVLIERGVIGAKRNAGCRVATGEIIAVWDDDDHSSPERIAHQVARLNLSGKSVTGYHTMKFTDGVSWWLFTGDPFWAFGTSLCFRREYWARNPFIEKQVGEDTDFVANAYHDRQLDTAHALDMMHATIHAGNTSPRTVTVGTNWRKLS